KDVDVAKLVAKTGHLVVAQRVDHLVGKLLARHVANGSLSDSPLDLVSNRLHEMGFPHTDAAIEEQRVISVGWTLGYRLTRGMGELVTVADDEGIEGIAGIGLGCAIPIEARLAEGTGGNPCRSGSSSAKPAVVADRRCRRIVLRRHEFDILVFQAEIVDRFLDQIGVLVSNMLKLRRRHSDEQNGPVGVTVSGGFKPSVVGMAVNFLFECVENSDPRIGSKSSCARRRHKEPSWRGLPRCASS